MELAGSITKTTALVKDDARNFQGQTVQKVIEQDENEAVREMCEVNGGCDPTIVRNPRPAAHPPSQMSIFNDPKLQSDVLRAFGASKEVKSLAPINITVSTHEGVVTLSGTVSSIAISKLLGSIARGVPYVMDVNNQLKVVTR